MITILITNYNTLDFVELSLYALKMLTKNNYEILINDNGSNLEEIKKLKDIERSNNNIRVNYRKTSSLPSYAHGEALDILISMVKTKYFVVLDSDCTFLMKYWDEYMISKINNSVKIVGSTYTINERSKKKNDFPAQFAVLFETEIYKKLEISCMPKNTSDKDTCWEWREKYLSQNYKGFIFDQKNTREFKDTKFGNIICVTFFTEDNRLIASHFGRGSSGSGYKYKNRFITKIPLLGKVIRNIIAKNEKKLWIETCKNIVDSNLK